MLKVLGISLIFFFVYTLQGNQMHLYHLTILTDYNYYHSSKVHQNFPGGSDGKASAYNAGDPGSIPG